MSANPLSNLPNERLLSGVDGAKIMTLRGRLGAMSTSIQSVWSAANTYAHITSAVAMEAVSSSANDAAAGTGARTIEVDGVDGSGVQTTQVGGGVINLGSGLLIPARSTIELRVQTSAGGGDLNYMGGNPPLSPRTK